MPDHLSGCQLVTGSSEGMERGACIIRLQPLSCCGLLTCADQISMCGDACELKVVSSFAKQAATVVPSGRMSQDLRKPCARYDTGHLNAGTLISKPSFESTLTPDVLSRARPLSSSSSPDSSCYCTLNAFNAACSSFFLLLVLVRILLLFIMITSSLLLLLILVLLAPLHLLQLPLLHSILTATYLICCKAAST